MGSGVCCVAASLPPLFDLRFDAEPSTKLSGAFGGKAQTMAAALLRLRLLQDLFSWKQAPLVEQLSSLLPSDAWRCKENFWLRPRQSG